VYENASTHDLWKIEQNTTQIIEKQAIFITTDHTFIKNISIQKNILKYYQATALLYRCP